MPRAPNEKVKQAQEMYQKGMKLVEIAQQLELPAGTIRRWKNTYQWVSKRSEKKANVRKEKCDNPKEIDYSRKEEIFEQLENTDLSDKQRLFCAYYLRTFNATKSYQKAYGCSYQTALTNGPALLGNTRIKNEIKELKKQRMERELLTEEDIFQRYVDIAFADITDFVSFGQEEETVMGPFGPIMVKGEDGKKHELKKMINTVKFRESIEVDGQLISQIKMGRDGASIKLYDKMKALEWLYQYCMDHQNGDNEQVTNFTQILNDSILKLKEKQSENAQKSKTEIRKD